MKTTRIYGRDRSTETAFDYVQKIARAVTGGSRAGDISDDFIQYCRTTVESVQFIRNAAILHKRDFPQRKYRVRSVSKVTERAHEQDAGTSYARVPAVLVNADQSVLRAFGRLYGNGIVTVPAVSGKVTNARVLGSDLVTVGSSIIDESLNCIRNLRRGSGLYQVVRGSIWVDEQSSGAGHHKVPAVNGQRHVLLKQTWDSNYGHWIVDTLPKVGLMASSKIYRDASSC